MKILLSYLLVSYSLLLFSQVTFQDYILREDSIFNEYQRNFYNEFEYHSNTINNEFKQYQDSINEEFAQYLKNDWESFNLSLQETPSLNKPEKPFVMSKKINRTIPKNSFQTQRTVETDKNKSKLNSYLKAYSQYAQKGTFKFCDADIEIFYEDLSFTLHAISNNGASNCWAQLNKTNYLPIVYQLLQYKHQYKLSDWSFVLLIKELGQFLYKNTNKSTLFTWFILRNSGYSKVQVGILHNRFYLLIPNSMDIYNICRLKQEDYFLYVIDLNNVKSRVCDVSYKDIITYKSRNQLAQRNEINMFQVESLSFGNRYNIIERKFTFRDKDYSFKIPCNSSLLEMYNSYLHCQPEIYFSSHFSEKSLTSIKKQLSPIFEGKTNKFKVEFLLAFTQEAFNYSLDKKQFNEERWLFPEEVLFYPYSDCEDRSVLFAKLVTLFTDLDVIGIKYKDTHIATAIHFDEIIDGDSIIVKGKKYIICDPTSLFAKIGESVPELKKTKVDVIEFQYLTN